MTTETRADRQARRQRDRWIALVRFGAAGAALTVALVAEVTDAPSWLTVVATVAASGLALLTRAELLVGTDLDGDGRIGPRLP